MGSDGASVNAEGAVLDENTCREEEGLLVEGGLSPRSEVRVIVFVKNIQTVGTNMQVITQ